MPSLLDRETEEYALPEGISWDSLDILFEKKFAPESKSQSPKSEPELPKGVTWDALDAFLGAREQEPKKLSESKQEPGFLSEAGKGLARVPYKMAEAANIGLQAVANQAESGWLEKKVGLDKPAKALGEWAGKNVQALSEMQRNIGIEQHEKYKGKNIWDNPELLKEPAWYAGGVAEMAGDLGLMIGTGMGAFKVINEIGRASKMAPILVNNLAKLGSRMAGGLAGGSLEATQTYKDVYAKTGDHKEATMAAAIFFPAVIALNALQMDALMRPIGKGLLAKGGKALINFLTEGTSEGLEEPTEVAAKLAAKIIEGKKVPDDWKELFYDSLKDALTVAPIAGLAGGGMATITGEHPSVEAYKQDLGTSGRRQIQGFFGEAGEKFGLPPNAKIKPLLDRISHDLEAGAITTQHIEALKDQYPELKSNLNDIMAANVAKRKGLVGERKDRYVYGTMRQQGWVPDREKQAKRKRLGK